MWHMKHGTMNTYEHCRAAETVEISSLNNTCSMAAHVNRGICENQLNTHNTNWVWYLVSGLPPMVAPTIRSTISFPIFFFLDFIQAFPFLVALYAFLPPPFLSQLCSIARRRMRKILLLELGQAEQFRLLHSAIDAESAHNDDIQQNKTRTHSTHIYTWIEWW